MINYVPKELKLNTCMANLCISFFTIWYDWNIYSIELL